MFKFYHFNFVSEIKMSLCIGGFQLSQSGKHRVSSYDISGMDPDDESITDFTKNELLVFKTSFARPKYANTYRMEPYRKCESHIVRKRTEDILKVKYFLIRIRF